MKKKILAIIGTYRKGHVTDNIVDEMLKEVSLYGVETKKIYLLDKDIKFCTNCRACTQNQGLERGKCVIHDDMENLLNEVDACGGMILVSPVNFLNVTAITRRFMERTIPFAFWPWGVRKAPTLRNKIKTKKAVVVLSSAAPGFLIPIFTGALKSLKLLASVLGAKVVGKLCIGTVGIDETELISASIINKAKKLSKKLL